MEDIIPDSAPLLNSSQASARPRYFTMATSSEKAEDGSEKGGSDNGGHETPLPAVPAAVKTKLLQRSDRAFDNDSLEDHYKPIESYEGLHRYDPKFEWTAPEEKRVIRKVCLPKIFQRHLPYIDLKLT